MIDSSLNSRANEEIASWLKYCYRMPGIDYSEPRYYMITFRKNPLAPPFSVVKGNLANQNHYCDYNPLGFIIAKVFKKFNSDASIPAKIENRVIMPDHIHFMLRVTGHLDIDFSSYLIASIKGECTREYWNQFPQSPLTENRESIFAPKFQDTVVYARGILDRLINYIKDNPRRYLIKRKYPDLFKCNMQIEIDGEVFQAIGNPFLLKKPGFVFIKYHRAWSEEETRKQIELWKRDILNHGVMVSPFYHPIEKEILEWGLERGGSAIQIEYRHYGPRDKPHGKWFDLCAQGRLLVVAAGPPGEKGRKINYAIATRLNGIARKICLGATSCKIKRIDK